MIHSIVFLLSVIPLTFFWALWAIVFKNIRNGPDYSQRTWSRLLVRLSGVRIKADLSAVPPGVNPVFMVNHTSNLDIPVVVTALNRYPIKFVAKKSLFDIPVFGASMRAAGHISIDRSNRRAGMKSIDKAVETAQTGVSPLIFPEGTRNTDPEHLMDFKIGGIILALKCSIPVVPVVVAGMDRVLPKGSAWVNPGPVLVKALPPLDTSAYSLKDREKFKEDLYRVMDSAYTELRRELPAQCGNEAGDNHGA